eukprot:Lankesteria_metandrocarpae@DN310_c0_g1_i2.p1
MVTSLSGALDNPCVDPSCSTDPSTNNGVVGPPNKWELGKAAWLYLHAYAGSSLEVNGGQHRTTWLETFADLFPCSECRPHFVETLRRHPPPVPPASLGSSSIPVPHTNTADADVTGGIRVGSTHSSVDKGAAVVVDELEEANIQSVSAICPQDVDFALWMCEVHNDVNLRLDKPVYPCVPKDLLRWQL